MQYRIKNWEQFQHFKDRLPPWIKVYRSLLDDPDWHALDGEDAKVLVMLWLVASEDKLKVGTLPASNKLAFRLRMNESTLIQTISRLYHWVEQVDINLISPRYRGDAPETETETETEEEAYASSAPRRKRREAAEIRKIVFDYALGQWEGIEVSDAAAWETAYPALVIETELFRAAEWVKANPANRKSNWRRFLTNWFSRAQERAPRRAS